MPLTDPDDLPRTTDRARAPDAGASSEALTTDAHPGQENGAPPASSASEATPPCRPRGEPPGERPPPLPAVPGYEVLGVIGRGGMGVVYKARHLSLKRTVALKMILAGGHAGEHDRQRFRLEAEAVARVQHPNVVQIFEVGSHNGHDFLALEFIPGTTLADLCDGKPQSHAWAAQKLEVLARAVHYLHQQGVVHRDLKPGNVMLAHGTTLKVMDFGLARQLEAAPGLTATGAVIGTPSFMAPEQAGGEGKRVGPAADVWALGAILYYLLAGRPPFLVATTFDTLRQVVGAEPVRLRQLQPEVPRELETVCHRCLQKDPARRYASAAALAEDLRRFQAHEPILVRPAGVGERGVKWVRKNPAL